jgi:hypothetical protein
LSASYHGHVLAIRKYELRPIPAKGRIDLKTCPECGSALEDEDERCGVCGNLYSETIERRVDANPVDKEFTKKVRNARILFGTGILTLGFGIATIAESGFGSFLIFISGIASLTYAIWMIPRLVLGGFGTATRGYGKWTRAYRPWFREIEIREEEKHEDPDVKEERREEDFD